MESQDKTWVHFSCRGAATFFHHRGPIHKISTAWIWMHERCGILCIFFYVRFYTACYIFSLLYFSQESELIIQGNCKGGVFRCFIYNIKAHQVYHHRICLFYIFCYSLLPCPGLPLKWLNAQRSNNRKIPPPPTRHKAVGKWTARMGTGKKSLCCITGDTKSIKLFFSPEGTF